MPIHLKDEKILFIHLPKCAGHYISQKLRTIGGRTNGGLHKTIPLKEKIKYNKIIGNIRNPFEYYVSDWSYGCLRKGGPWQIFTQRGKRHQHLFSDSSNVHNFQKWIKMLHNEVVFDTPACGKLANAEHMYDKNDIGFFTFRFFKLYNQLDYELLKTPEKNTLIDDFIRFEKIDEDLNRIFNIPIQKTEKLNRSKHLDYREYYNDELIEFIYHKDKYLIDKFNYQF